MRRALVDVQVLDTDSSNLEQHVRSLTSWIPKVSLPLNIETHRTRILQNFWNDLIEKLRDRILGLCVG